MDKNVEIRILKDDNRYLRASFKTLSDQNIALHKCIKVLKEQSRDSVNEIAKLKAEIERLIEGVAE